MGCHNVGLIRFLGGGNLGPDLTGAYTAFGEAGLEAALSDIEFPTMAPLYADHPLTAGEVGDLAAFLKLAARRKSTNMEPMFLYLSGAGFLLFMSVTWIAWRGRIAPVRRALTERYGSYPGRAAGAG